MNSEIATGRFNPNALRSRRGCITCRSKKVKCDEVHPVCSRCQRLHRNCEWQTVDQSRKEIKHDKAAPIPKKILPNIQSGEKAVSVNSPIQKIRIPNHSSSLSDSSETLETSSICDTVGFKRELDREDAPPEGLGGQYSNALPAIIRAVDLQVPIGPKSSLNFMTPSQIVDCVALAPSFKFTQNESRGLHHFQISLVTPRTTKRNAPWSTLGAVLSLGSQVPMVMHIIIATSLMDLAMCYDYDPKICFKAQTHFKTGAQLLINAMNHGSEPNHVTVLACFYFIHIYMQRRKEMDASAIKQVSRAIVQHIKRYDLDLCCAGTLSPQQQQIRCPGAAGLSPREIELMARIMMLLYYEDVIGCSKGFGGALADHLTARKERMKDIQQISVSSLESFWGAQYPDVEVVDDVEHITILDFLHEIWITNQLVNQYFTSASTYPSEIPDIEAHIAALEQKAKQFIALVSSTPKPRPYHLKNADFIVSYYYAVRLLHQRYKLSYYPTEDALAPASAALTPLLVIAQRVFAAKDTEYYERYQWPLFLAGIETDDAIHRDWITERVTDRRLRRALELVVELQGQEQEQGLGPGLGPGLGERRKLGMLHVKRLICGEDVMPL